MQKKKDTSNKTRPQLPSEEKPSDILAHELLAHQDKDPIYPFQPVKIEKLKGPDFKKQNFSKSNHKNKHKKN
ncbi:MAG: hypothetical protein K2X08_01595 [Chlamydiales bacterium]|nr:hypothetical protein [Chlamydiales bacterium]